MIMGGSKIGVLLGRGSTDWLWGGLGVGAATVSASFAAYMVVVGPEHVRFPSAPNFGVLAHLGPRRVPVDSHATALLQGQSDRLPVLASAGENPRTATEPASAGLDFAPTGSVDGRQDQAPGVTPGAGPPVLKGFILRDVFDGKALVESRDAIRLVTPGTTLDGAGEILAIRQQGEAWVITTSKGIITAASR